MIFLPKYIEKKTTKIKREPVKLTFIYEVPYIFYFPLPGKGGLGGGGGNFGLGGAGGVTTAGCLGAGGKTTTAPLGGLGLGLYTL